jgi:hypothetical protein
MDTVATIECLKCKTSVLMKIRKPEDGEAAIFVVATNVKLPCGHNGSDDKRWAGFVTAMEFETET